MKVIVVFRNKWTKTLLVYPNILVKDSSEYKKALSLYLADSVVEKEIIWEP